MTTDRLRAPLAEALQEAGFRPDLKHGLATTSVYRPPSAPSAPPVPTGSSCATTTRTSARRHAPSAKNDAAAFPAERAARPDGHEHHPDTRSDHAHCVDCGEAFSVDFASPAPALDATPIDVSRLADALHAVICGPFTTIDPQKCIHGRGRDIGIAEAVARRLVPQEAPDGE